MPHGGHKSRNEWAEVPDKNVHWTSVKYSIAGVGGPEEALTREEIMEARKGK